MARSPSLSVAAWAWSSFCSEVDLVVQGLHLLTLGLIFLLQVGEAALKVVGSCDRLLEADDGDLRWPGGYGRRARCSGGDGRRLCGGIQREAGSQCGYRDEECISCRSNTP